MSLSGPCISLASQGKDHALPPHGIPQQPSVDLDRQALVCGFSSGAELTPLTQEGVRSWAGRVAAHAGSPGVAGPGAMEPCGPLPAAPAHPQALGPPWWGRGSGKASATAYPCRVAASGRGFTTHF